MNKWKTIAIIFIVLLIAENLFIGWGYYLVNEDNKAIRTCYYDICSEYPNAEYEDKVCYCYEHDLFGDYQVAKTEVMD